MPVNEPGNMRPLINKIVNTKYGSVAVPQTTIPKCRWIKLFNQFIYLFKPFSRQRLSTELFILLQAFEITYRMT